MTRALQAVCLELAEHRAELRALRYELAEHRRAAGQKPRRQLAFADREWLAAFLPAAAAAIGDRVWTCHELAALALRAECAPLTATLEQTGGDGLRRFGKRLARVAGHAVGALELRRAGDSSAGVLWQVFETLESHRTDTARARVAA